MRETLFNWLGQTLAGKRCLDLFSGSGVLGFEAVSRGAAEVAMVEKNRTVFRALKANSQKLSCVNIALHCEDGIEFIRRESGRYDVIFLDPPFQSDFLIKVLPLLGNRLSEAGTVYIESGEPFQADTAEWKVTKQAKAGKVYYQLLQKVKS